MRELTDLAHSELNAQETDEVFLLLLTIDEESLSEPIRAVHNTEDVTSRGLDYAAVFFNATLPDETDSGTPQVRITLDNVSQEIVKAVRAAVGRPSVTMEVVLASDPDTVEAGPFEFELEAVEYDELTVTGTLTFDDVTETRWPAHKRSSYLYPDL